ncbi:MAG TPA: sialidase family protein [Chloroflexota bacterium]|nr:sialidase family protein [Chloroflexota bacterium]
MTSAHYPSGTVVLLAGTKRGLFVLSSQDRKTWTVDSQPLTGPRIFNAILDQRNGTRMFAAENGDFFGTFLRYSDDFGETWQEPAQGIQFAEESGRKIVNIWVIEPGRANEPHTLYAGIDPASLWKSTDWGETWELTRGLEEHPTRENWGPGAGGLCLHSIVPDYSNPDRMWIGISAVGCMRTEDGGRTWMHVNKGTRNDFLPDKYPEYGQCIHRLVQHPTEPDTLYQQNHCGVYLSTNGGDDWIDIRNNLPSDFGFPIALDRHNPETLFTIAEDGWARNNFSEGFTVYRTTNAGEHWESMTNGLPRGAGVRLGVLRHGMCADGLDPCGVYVGTNTGQIFASADRGESWQLIADFMPSVYSVTTAVIK